MNTRTPALLITGLTVLTALIALLERNGFITWVALIFALALLVKLGLRPSKLDLSMSIGIAAVSVLAWVGTWFYVISSYESGEVVELVIDTNKGSHTARLWVFDMEDAPFVYYDAEPHVAASLLMGKPVQFIRGGNISTRIPKATKIETLSGEQANAVLAAMQSKYGNRMQAADIYYFMIGSPRDRVVLIADLSDT